MGVDGLVVFSFFVGMAGVVGAKSMGWPLAAYVFASAVGSWLGLGIPLGLAVSYKSL